MGVAAALAAIAALYLIMKAFQAPGGAGYDFRFIWTAGKIWLEGVSPYGADFTETARTLIAQGNVPELWPYPPNWWPICTLFGLLDINTAFLAWKLVSVIAVMGASLLLIRAYQTAYPGAGMRAPFWGDLLQRPWVAACLHAFAVAALEATAIILSTGQTTCLVYFGAALLLYGMSVDRGWMAVAGFVLVFLKPQLGVVLGAVFFLLGKEERRLVLAAALVSAILSLPAFVIDPGLIEGFLHNLARYDEISKADAPQEMTGLRILVWQGQHIDFGSIPALFVSAALAVALCVGPFRAIRAESAAARAWQAVSISVAVLLAMGPLHYYDFVLLGLLPFALFAARGWLLAAGIVGSALIFRADTLARLTGWRDSASTIFEGSLMATLGGVLILVCVVGAIGDGKPATAIRSAFGGFKASCLRASDRLRSAARRGRPCASRRRKRPGEE